MLTNPRLTLGRLSGSLLALTLFLAVMCSGAQADIASTGVSPTGRTVNTMISGGVTRTYIVYRPAKLIAPKAPLVIVLHGGSSTGWGMEGLTGFDTIAAANGFEVTYPYGYPTVVSGKTYYGWHIGCCGSPGDSPVDMSFISQLITRLESTDGIDPSRIYVVGFSEGAAMAYRLACQDASQVAAIASAGGFEYLDTQCKPGRPVSVYEMHGTKDYYNGSCGGTTQSNAGCPNGFGTPGYEPSVAQTDAQWRATDGCRTTANAAATIANGAMPITRQIWSACSYGSSVQLDTVNNGTHCYPFIGANPLNQCSNFSASQLFWNFFAPLRLAP